MTKKSSSACSYQIDLQDDLNQFAKAGSPFTDLIKYLQTGESTAFYNGKALVSSGGSDLFKVDNGYIQDTGVIWEDFYQLFLENKPRKTVVNELKVFNNVTTSAIFINCKRRKANKNLKQMLLLSGDKDSNFLVDQTVQFEFPVTSFSCMGRFYKSKKEFIDRTIKGKTAILDYRPSEFRDLSAEDKKILKRKKDNILTPPEPGFTLISAEAGWETKKWHWHRSGNVLFYDEEKEMCILTGQDEGTFFGVELPKKCNTVAQALEALVPKEAKCKEYLRQGEWFLVPVDEKNIPELKDCLIFQEEMGASVCLPVETNDSNAHHLTTFRLRVDEKAIFARKPILSHPQHRTIYGNDQWYAFYKNTALRSFSEEGVD